MYLHRPRAALYDPKLNPNFYSRNTLFEPPFLTKKEYYGNEGLVFRNFVRFCTIIVTFIRFSYTTIRSWTPLYDLKPNLYIFSLTHSNNKQFLPTLINHIQTNPFRTIVKICNHSLYPQTVIKFFLPFSFIQYKKEKMLTRASLKDDISQATKERKAKLNEQTQTIYQKQTIKLFNNFFKLVRYWAQLYWINEYFFPWSSEWIQTFRNQIKRKS